jgi:hypothetical protein
MAEMNDEFSMLQFLNTMLAELGGLYDHERLESFCGRDYYACFNAFYSIIDNLPSCADKMILNTRFFHYETGLALTGVYS